MRMRGVAPPCLGKVPQYSFTHPGGFFHSERRRFYAFASAVHPAMGCRFANFGRPKPGVDLNVGVPFWVFTMRSFSILQAWLKLRPIPDPILSFFSSLSPRRGLRRRFCTPPRAPRMAWPLQRAGCKGPTGEKPGPDRAFLWLKKRNCATKRGMGVFGICSRRDFRRASDLFPRAETVFLTFLLKRS